MVAYFLIVVPLRIAIAGDKESNIRGWVFNRDGWKVPDYELIDKLERWESYWRQGCYSTDSVCVHSEAYHRRVKHYTRHYDEVRNDPLRTWESENQAERVLIREMNRDKPDCVELDNELKVAYRFHALREYTEGVNELVERNEAWVIEKAG